MIALESEVPVEEYESPSVRARRRSFCAKCLRIFSFCTNQKFLTHLFEENHPPVSVPVRQPYVMKTGQRWVLVCFTVISLIAVTILLSSVRYKHGSLTISLDLDELTDRGKCPACFGVNLCPPMISGKIELNDWTKYSVSKLVNSKNIFYATWRSRGVERNVILKKLAHDSELERLDKEICTRHGKKEDQCDVTDTVKKLIDQYSYTTKNHPDDPILHGEKIGKVTDILLCPSHAKMEFIVRKVQKIQRGPNERTILAHILTMLLVNPEPLILQTFPAEEGWPFPVYYGACGRIVAEEYVGNRLTTYYKYDFHTRATISVELLEIAFKLSENDSEFILYLTDISPDNFAVNENGDSEYKVKVVDLENIIIVDKKELDAKLSNGGKIHESESMPCQNKQNGNSEGECLSFSIDDLCVQPLTDHNFYAICAGLLAADPFSQEFSKGLLHSPPASLTDSKLSEYLESCRKPGPKYNRIEAARKLKDVLQHYLDTTSR